MNVTLSLANTTLIDKIEEISIYIYPITQVIGVVTNVLNICVLCRRSFRFSPCTHYFLAFTIASLFYMSSLPIAQYLRIRYDTEIRYALIPCKLMSFFFFSLPTFMTLILVLASADRFCASSTWKYLHELSQVQKARQIIIGSVVVTIIYMSPFLVIYHLDESTGQCIPISTIITTIVYLSSRVVFTFVITPLAMTTFGLMTIRNIRVQQRRLAPMIIDRVTLERHRRTERQIARMLLVQVGFYVIFSVPIGITYTMTTFVPSMNTPLIIGLRSIASLWQQCNYIAPFFLFMLSARVYRKELERMFKSNSCRAYISHIYTRIFPSQRKASIVPLNRFQIDRN